MPIPTGPFARYLASDLSGTLNDADPVASWPDASGNGHDAVQATAGDQPFYRDATTGLPDHACVDFLNVDTRRLLSATFGAALSTSTWAAVVSIPQVLGGPRVLLDGDTGRHAVFYDADEQWAMFAGSVVAGTTVATADVHTIIGVFDGASSALYIDGLQVATGDVGAQALDRVVLGAESDGNGQTDVEMVEVLLYDRALDGTERTALLDYFGTTYLGSAPPGSQLRVHDAKVELGDAPPAGLRLRVHGAGMGLTTIAPAKTLLVHRAGVAVGQVPVTEGGIWVRVGGVWVKHRAYTRVDGAWV